MQNKHEKKGIIRIVFGFILVFLQILSYIGYSVEKAYSYDYMQEKTFNIFNWIGFNIPIIVGIFLLIFGFWAYSTNENKHEEELKQECFQKNISLPTSRLVSHSKPELSSLENVELCPMCGADISSDNENCHVCGAEITR